MDFATHGFYFKWSLVWYIFTKLAVDKRDTCYILPRRPFVPSHRIEFPHQRKPLKFLKCLHPHLFLIRTSIDRYINVLHNHVSWESKFDVIVSDPKGLIYKATFLSTGIVSTDAFVSEQIFSNMYSSLCRDWQESEFVLMKVIESGCSLLVLTCTLLPNILC